MTRFDGADLSHHQDDAGPIDWPTLRQASWWVATKVTQGLAYVDPTFTAHRAEMTAQGFTHRGLYGWIEPMGSSTAQAQHFLSTVGTLSSGEFAMCDAEQGGITAAMVLEWVRTVEAVTHRPVAVYTGAFVAGGTIWQSTEIRHSNFGPRPMHLAAYTTEAKAKALPGVKAYPWSAWQYSSDGPVPGVVGRCDMNRVDDVAVYDVACGISHPVVEDDMKLYSNAEDRLMPYGPDQAGHVKFLVDTFKRNVGPGEYRAGGWDQVVAIPLSNADLDAIPDAGATTNPAAIQALNNAVGRLGQRVGDIQLGLIHAGGG